MIDMLGLLEELVKTDISQTPVLITMRALRDAIAKELGPESGRMESVFRPKEIATQIVSEMKIELNTEFVSSEDFPKAIDLTAKLIGKFWDAMVPEFGEQAFLNMARKFELVRT